MKAWFFAILSGVVTWVVVGSIPNMFGNFGFLAAIFVLFVGPFAGFKVGAFVREQTKERNGAQEQRARENESQLRDGQYDCIVNCPTCEGSGECWMDHRVTCEGHILTPTPQRRVDIEHMMDENFQYYRPETHYHVDSYGTSYSYKRGVCPHCEGAGTAFARFETVPESEASCPACSGRGIITQTVKVAVGVDKVQAQCPSCAGSGQMIVPQIRRIHVRFLSQSKSQTFDLASFEPSNFFDMSKPRFGSGVG